MSTQTYYVNGNFPWAARTQTGCYYSDGNTKQCSLRVGSTVTLGRFLKFLRKHYVTSIAGSKTNTAWSSWVGIDSETFKRFNHLYACQILRLTTNHNQVVCTSSIIVIPLPKYLCFHLVVGLSHAKGAKLIFSIMTYTVSARGTYA